jgi:hypothetical protein
MRIKNTKIITSMTKLQNNRIAINNKTIGNINHLHQQNDTVINANTKNEIRVVIKVLKINIENMLKFNLIFNYKILFNS